MKLLARLEADGLSRSDRDFGAGAWVAPDSGFSRFDSEDTKATELDAISFNQRPFHAFEDGVDRCFCLGARQSGAFDNPLYQVLLDHLRYDPSLWIP